MTTFLSISKLAVIASFIPLSFAQAVTSSHGSHTIAITPIKKHLKFSGSQEVPANNSPAQGTADVVYDEATHTLTFSVKYQGLTGPATMAHIHGPASKGENAGVLVDLTGYLEKSASGHFSNSVKVDGKSLNQDTLLAGRYYINIHTAKHPGGEIRTQLDLK